MTQLRATAIHGFLETCLLSLVAAEPDYGLGLAQRLSAAGFESLPGGTIYPALVRLEKRGWVGVTWQPSASGPPRKYYRVTTEGLRGLEQLRADWSDFVRIVGRVVEEPGVRRHP